MNLPQVTYKIFYDNKDITADISSAVMSFEYADKLTGASDELSLTLEDSRQYFQGNWYPKKGSQIKLIIYSGAAQLDCGVFEIDEPELSISTSGDIFTIKGLAAGITKKLRSHGSYAHSDKTLREIAATVAAGLGLTVMGNVPGIRFGTANQYHETPLQFLNRIGSDYGCIFSVRGNQLIFTSYVDLASAKAAVTLGRKDIISASLKDATHKTFKKCKVSYMDPATKQLITHEETETDNSRDEGNDEDTDHSRVEDQSQAEQKAKYALFKNNTAGVGGDITLPGNLLLVAGNNVALTEVGFFNGTYQIRESKHSYSRDAGYQTSCNIQRVSK